MTAQLKSVIRYFPRMSLIRRFSAKVSVGSILPDVLLYENTPNNTIRIRDIFKKRKGILFTVPGAFTPGCSQAHIPGYLLQSDDLHSHGYETIVCVAVNDPYVMAAWEKDIGAKGKIRLLSDMKCEFTKAVGMELDYGWLLGNVRSKRYSMIIEDNIIKKICMEPDDTGLACLLCIQNMHNDSHSLKSANKRLPVD